MSTTLNFSFFFLFLLLLEINGDTDVKKEVLTEGKMKIKVFWDKLL
jgi:hypothetical protein